MSSSRLLSETQTPYGQNWRVPTHHTGGGGTHPRADAGGPGCDRAAGPGGKLCHIYYKYKPKPHSRGPLNIIAYGHRPHLMLAAQTSPRP